MRLIKLFLTNPTKGAKMSLSRAFLKKITITLVSFFWIHLSSAQGDPCLGKKVFAIETATALESTKLLALISPYQEVQNGGIKYYCGTFENHPVLLMNTGIGKVYAAATTASLINTYHPKFILFVGIAGQLDSKLKYGDIVVGNEVYQVEHIDMSVKRTNHINPNSGLIYSSLLKPKNETLEFVKTLPTFKNFSVTYGRIATTDTFPETKELLKQILASNSSAVAMEDYSVIATCQLLNTDCLTIRAISDNPQKILQMKNVNEYHVGANERLSTAEHLAEYVKVFLGKWGQTNN